MRKSITLVELIIAIVIGAAIILAMMAFNAASRKFLVSSEKRSSVLNDISFVLEHIHKNVFAGTGDVDNPSITVIKDSPDPGDFTVEIRQDMDETGVSHNTPQDYNDDRKAVYIFDFSGNKINYKIIIPNAGVYSQAWEEDISENLIFEKDGEALKVEQANGGLVLNNLCFRYNPADENIDPRDNPQIEIDEQFFFPFSQSLN
ncbi:MAG: hypothetical protein PHU64_06575 [Candidatus Omnitrophica bacterium]|nr:hypothetical protein [Candidatus Omnitrophota bacterium]MDD5429799.1 hypothetical protein [Candidatus Omnitrophota bacterium]